MPRAAHAFSPLVCEVDKDGETELREARWLVQGLAVRTERAGI